MKYLAATSLAAVVALAAACSHDAPTAQPVEPASASSAAAAGALDFGAELGDIETRMMPGFTDAAAADRLRGHLAELRVHLAAGDRAEAARVLGLSRAVLADGPTSAADSWAINSTLDVIARDLAY